MSKARELNKLVEKKDYAETFEPGNELVAKDFDGSEEEVEYLIDNGISFSVDQDDIEEAHIYDFQDVYPHDLKHGWGGWPVASKEGNLVKLESSFGHGKENYLLCKMVKAEQN
jgi:hypothetical protein